MSYKLEKPYTQKEKEQFYVKYNHNQGLKIEETSKALYALEANEVMKNGKPVINPDYEKEQAQKRQEQFETDFFLTSLGYIRRKVTMANGDIKDFLADLLPSIAMGVQFGQTVSVITYKEPDAKKDLTEYQETKQATLQFVQECFAQLNNDFLPAKDDVKNSETDANNTEKLEDEKSDNNNISDDEM